MTAGPGRNGERSFHGEKRSNETHASTTDREAQLHRKGRGKEAKLAFLGHALMENRNGLIVDADPDAGQRLAERQAAQPIIARLAPDARRLTLGADKAYDTQRPSLPTCGSSTSRRTWRRTTPIGAPPSTGAPLAMPGYAVSQQKRKRIEELFGWGKTIGGLARPMFRGIDRLRFKFTLTMASYNLIRIPKLIEATSMSRQPDIATLSESTQ